MTQRTADTRNKTKIHPILWQKQTTLFGQKTNHHFHRLLPGTLTWPPPLKLLRAVGNIHIYRLKVGKELSNLTSSQFNSPLRTLRNYCRSPNTCTVKTRGLARKTEILITQTMAILAKKIRPVRRLQKKAVLLSVTQFPSHGTAETIPDKLSYLQD